MIDALLTDYQESKAADFLSSNKVASECFLKKEAGQLGEMSSFKVF